MRIYLELLNKIIEEGDDREDRTGIGTRSIFGTQLRFNLEDGFPLLTTKRMFWRGIVEELLFFVRGETDSKKLEEKKIFIWSGNTSKTFLEKRDLPYPEGEIGPGYGFQWRNWGGSYIPNTTQQDENRTKEEQTIIKKPDGIDQLAKVIETLQTNPFDRRMLVSAWNPTQNDQMALPPCHLMFQFYVSNNRLSCQFYMRSVDVALGLPFNIASYALLTHFMAEISGYQVGELIFVGGDTHLYKNHFEGVQEQLKRTPYPLPTLQIKKEIESLKSVESLSFDDIKLHNYQHFPSIKMSMAV